MSSAHVVDECRLELAFRSERQALDGQVRWESFVKGRLLAVAEEVFDEVSVPGEIRRFDLLSVDLGSADPETSGPELERRMREQLRAAMRDAVHGSRSRALAEGRILTLAFSDLEQVLHFLSSGRLPWHSRQGANTGIDDAVRRVLQANAAAFAQWLRGASQRPSVILRLARQFPEDGLEQVGTLLAPGRAAFLGALARLLESVFGDVGTGPGARVRIRRMVWEGLISAVLSRGSATIDEVGLAREAIERVARLLRGSYGATATAVRDAVTRLRAMPAPELDVGGAFHALRRATSANEIEPARAVDTLRAAGREPASKPAAGSWKWGELSSRLDRAVMLGDAEAVRVLWRTLVREHAGFVITVVRRRGTLAKVRRRMAEGLPEPMLHDIVCLLEPTHSEFISEIVHRPDLFQAGIADPAPQPDTLRRRMWEFTLTYLLVERGGGFNKQEYIGSVVRQMAAHHNLGYGQLLAALTGVLEDVEARSALRSQMLELLHGLARQADSTPAARLDAPFSGEALAEGAAAYDEVAARLLRGARLADDPSDPLIASIERLAAEFPWQFVRLVRELEASAPSAARIADRLSMGALRRLILAIVALAHSRPGSTASEFSRSLDGVALRSRDPRRFLAQVLGCLLGGKSVDLEAIALRIGRDTASVRHAHSTDAMVADATARRRLQVMVEDWIAGGPVDAIAPAWGELVRGQPSLLRTVLRSRGRSERVRKAIVESATESMLRDLVQLLEPTHAGFIDEIVHRPELFRREPETPMPSAEGFKRRMWEFTLNYLLVERGGRFNKQAYLGSVVRRMAAHDNLAAVDLVHALIGVLENLSRPSSLQSEMLALLRTLAAETAAPSRPRRWVPRSGSRAKRSTVSADGPAPGSAGVLAAIAESLNSPGTLSAQRRPWLIQAIDREMATAPQSLRRCLASVLEDRRAIERLIDVLPESLLIRVLALLRPSEYARVLRCADLIATALLLALSPSSRSQGPDWPTGRAVSDMLGLPSHPASGQMARWKWQFIFGHLVAEGRSFDVARFARQLVIYLRRSCSGTDTSRLHERLLQQLTRSGIPSDRGRIQIIAEALSPLGTESATDIHRVVAEEEHAAPRPDKDSAAPLEALYVTNAGQVLAAPYLPRLFAMLQLTANGRFKDEGAAERAIHLLQFMVDGSTDSPEHLLALNKILCGVALDTPIEREVCLAETEKESVEGMIRGMIQNWKAIGGTSVAGLRESFLQREGRLQLKDDGWHLLVEPRAFDMLLDRIPWGYSTIKHPWMDRVVHVDWR